MVAKDNGTNTLHQRLRNLRREARVSADAVAPMVGMTPSSLRAHERGEREWYPELVDAYVTAVRVCAAERSQEVARGARGILNRNPRTDRTPVAGS